MILRGYIGKPESARKTRNEQYFFVNNRYIKHNYLHHAVVGAYEGMISEGYHPFYVLFIDIDPSHIDINIHPTKTEIKFDDERSVYAIVMAAVRKSMGVYNLSPSLNFESDVNFLERSGGRDALSIAAAQAASASAPKPITPSWAKAPGTSAPVDRDVPRPSPAPVEAHQKPTPQNWQALFEGAAPKAKLRPDKPLTHDVNWLEPTAVPQPAADENHVASAPPAPDGPTTVGSRANQLNRDRVDVPEHALMGSMETEVMQIQNRYFITTVKSGVLLIDQKAAYERILYDQFKTALTRRSGSSQQLLFPKTVTVSAVDFQLGQEVREELESVGFQYEEAGQNTFLIRGVPVQIGEEREEELFVNLLAQLRADTGRLKIDRLEALARSLAKRSASRYVKPLTPPERRSLVDQLFGSTSPSTTPDGIPVTAVLSLDKLAELMKGTLVK